jgi:chloramphenicol-sensitive protein RarD
LRSKGILFGLGAYALWGFFPLYWKQLHEVPALQLLAHRIGWSFLLLVGVVVLTGQWSAFRAALDGRTLRIYSAAAVLIAANWLTYVWAVNAGYIVETSLGYFINPLLSVLMGVLLLHERLRRTQGIPIALAGIGVAFLAFVYGRLPWIALLLAFSFGFYGLLKKVAPLGSLFGLTLETGILFVPALLYLAWSENHGSGAFVHAGLPATVLLFGAGAVTTIPLLLFASAAKRIPLSLLGILQYVAPTLQFMLGTLVYREPFDVPRLIGFSIVWLALILYAGESYLQRRLMTTPVPELGEG